MHQLMIRIRDGTFTTVAFTGKITQHYFICKSNTPKVHILCVKQNTLKTHLLWITLTISRRKATLNRRKHLIHTTVTDQNTIQIHGWRNVLYNILYRLHYSQLKKSGGKEEEKEKKKHFCPCPILYNTYFGRKFLLYIYVDITK